MKINGPISFPGTSKTPQRNQYGWTEATNIMYLDERILTGFSTGSNYDPFDSDVVVDATTQWFRSFFKQFPELKDKKLHYMGESFAGAFLPPIVEALRKEVKTLGISVSSAGVGNAAWGNHLALTLAVMRPYLETYRNYEYTRM